MLTYLLLFSVLCKMSESTTLSDDDHDHDHEHGDDTDIIFSKYVKDVS